MLTWHQTGCTVIIKTMIIDGSDPRWKDVAQVLVEYSVGVQRGDRVLLIMREPETFGAARAVAERCVRAGANVQTLFYATAMQRDLLITGTEEQIATVPELWRQGMEWADVCIDLRGARNLYEFSGIPSERIALMRRSEGEISALRTAQTRWTLLRIPNESFAQSAGRSNDDVAEFFFGVVLQDWAAESQVYRGLASRLEGTAHVRVVAEGTDLSFRTEGRRYVIDDGHTNMPGGEVFTAPIEDSVTGTISFRNPGVFAGVLMEDIRLEFRDGVVVDATARTNEDFLHRVLEMDAGARRVGEFGIGMNRRITFFSNDILFDEKIYGTIHFALGRSYTECGGRNESALHWDIVQDLRTEGRVYFDGALLFEDGDWRAS